MRVLFLKAILILFLSRSNQSYFCLQTPSAHAICSHHIHHVHFLVFLFIIFFWILSIVIICVMILSLSICSSLDPQLQDSLKEYLVSKGIGESLTNFLLLHLHKKEQVQYVNWLQKLESSLTKGKWQPVAGLTHTSVFFLINTQYILLYEDFLSYILCSLDSTAITSGILSCFFFPS